jgi:hypothetical protein
MFEFSDSRSQEKSQRYSLLGQSFPWRKPYFKVFYPADKDEEEMTLKDVLHHLNTDFLLER